MPRAPWCNTWVVRALPLAAPGHWSPHAPFRSQFLSLHLNQHLSRFSFSLSIPTGGFANTPGYDSEGKSLSIKRAFWGKATPHTVAFHLAWFGFMCAFVSSFAPAALITTIKDDLKLSKAQIANSNVAAVMGGVAARLFIGKFMDTAGPRKAFLLCLFGTTPFIVGITFVKSFAGYAACRFFIAMALAAVIPCIQWTTSM